MIQLQLDTRENSLISSIRARDLDTYTDKISISVQQLDIGDVIIKCEDKCWIFERKTVNDLIASVKDGRYKEQKHRLLSSCENITYIIEGDDIISSRNERHRTLLSSIYMYTLYRDDIKLIFTRNVEDTATFLLTMCSKIIDKPDNFLEKNPDDSNKKKSYVDFIKMKKISNITPDICYLMQLSQIPTISTTIAKYIQHIYPNMKSFINAIDGSNNKIELLCQIEKIGKDKAKKILDFLHFTIENERENQ